LAKRVTHDGPSRSREKYEMVTIGQKSRRESGQRELEAIQGKNAYNSRFLPGVGQPAIRARYRERLIDHRVLTVTETRSLNMALVRGCTIKLI